VTWHYFGYGSSADSDIGYGWKIDGTSYVIEGMIHIGNSIGTVDSLYTPGANYQGYVQGRFGLATQSGRRSSPIAITHAWVRRAQTSVH
jgi:hypothetical protein